MTGVPTHLDTGKGVVPDPSEFMRTYEQRDAPPKRWVAPAGLGCG
jgi:hypothetical protein